mgnify:CR=1 FL=1
MGERLRKHGEVLGVGALLVTTAILMQVGIDQAAERARDRKQYPVRGTVQADGTEVPGYRPANIYEIVIEDSNKQRWSYAFRGNEHELADLDKNINKGDYVKINPGDIPTSLFDPPIRLTDPPLSVENIKLVRKARD